MNVLSTFATEDWQTLASSLLHTLWLGAVAAIVLAGLLRWIPTSRPQTRYAVSLSSLAFVLLAGFITWAWLDHRQQHAPTIESRTPNEPALATFPDRPGAAEPSVSPANTTTPTHPIDYRTLVIITWLCGIAVMFIRMTLALQTVDALRRNCRPVADRNITKLLDQLLDASRDKEHRVRLLVADHLSGPVAMGVLWPAIILPASLLSGTTPDSIRAIIAHELAHIRRHDYLVNLGQMLVETLLFFNPAVWWISRQVRVEREACCDAEAARLIGDEIEYADVLASYAEAQSNTPLPAPAFSREKGSGSLGDRVRRLLIPGYQPRLRLPLQGLLFFLIIAGITLSTLHQGSRIAVAAGAKLLSPKERIEKIRAIQDTHAHEIESAKYDHEQLEEREYQVTISGTVLDEAGKPVKERDYQMHGRVERPGYSGSHTLNNETGSFTDTVGPGRIYITASGRRPGKYAPTLIGPLDGKIAAKLEDINIVLRTGFTSRLKLLDQQGNPIPNVNVEGIYDFAAYATTDNAKTDANGIASFNNLIAHPIKFKAKAQGFQEEQATFKLADGGITDWKLQPSAPAEVQIVATDGTPIVGATARLLRVKGANSMGYGQGQREVSATSDATGRMSFDGLRDDSIYWYVVEAKGHRRAILNEVHSGDTNRVFHLGPTLVVSGVIEGDLSQLRKRSRKNKKGKRVQAPYLNYSNPYKIRDHHSSYTEYTFVRIEDGKAYFEITNLWEGNITLYVGKERIKHKLTAPIRDLKLTIKKPEPPPTDPETGTLAEREVNFRFNTPRGNPAAQGKLYVVVDRKRPNGSTDWQELRVPVTNSIATLSVPIGSKVRCDPRDFTGYWFKGINSTAVEAGDTPLEFKLDCVPAGALYGTITEEDGSPARGIMITLVEVERANPKRMGSLDVRIKNSSSSSDLTERFNASPLPIGGTYMVVAHRGLNYAVSHPYPITRETPLQQIHLVMKKGIDLKGKVIDPYGKPVAAANFNLSFSPNVGSHGFSTSRNYTGRLGQFLVRNIVPDIAGKYSFEMNDNPGWRRQRVEFKPKEGEELKIVLQFGRRYSGKVVDAATGWPIPGIEVYALPKPPSSKRSGYLDADAKTNERGEFEFTTLDNGNYQLGIRSATITPRQEFIVRGDFTGEKTIPVTLAKWSKLKPVDPATQRDSN